jgi:hypothetical protein
MPAAPATPPTIDCRPLPAFASDDLNAGRRAFEHATPIPLGQAWLSAPEPEFAPAVVRTGWREDVLLIFAELTDADIFTAARQHNERFWELGDTFEMFLQPQPGRAYLELHVTPNNLRLQLRFAAPPDQAARREADPFEDALIRSTVFRSHTWLRPDDRAWFVLAEIPAAATAPLAFDAPAAPVKTLIGSRWRFSFSRYDWTRGRARPVISSSSPHREPGFHRTDEWGGLRVRTGDDR